MLCDLNTALSGGQQQDAKLPLSGVLVVATGSPAEDCFANLTWIGETRWLLGRAQADSRVQSLRLGARACTAILKADSKCFHGRAQRSLQPLGVGA